MDRKIIIAGNEFVIPQPFETGHTCTEGEARALNQLFSENIRNNLADKVKKGEVGQAEVTEYAAGYVFNAATMPKEKLDPVENEARKIARQLLKNAIKEAGGKIEDFTEETIETKVQEIAQMPDVVKSAKQIVDSRKKASAITLEGLNLAGAAAA